MFAGNQVSLASITHTNTKGEINEFEEISSNLFGFGLSFVNRVKHVEGKQNTRSGPDLHRSR